ncbi:UPF0701 protein YicC [Olavius algarvensis associated proteobacterium Delta 3]|nr:UPF0701 protein YicC [Olavius algarvensis associated proteobacterium Delta 3]CAB5084793.1 UPF0701 protein YicC [Olavius algarvensis associated proteobacterium Delta 3]
MIRSMTAYAQSEATVDQLTASAEVRSYNSRHLDLALRVPHGYRGLEERIKSLVTGFVDRGRVELHVKIRDESEKAFAYDINLAGAEAYHRALLRLKEHFDIDDAIPLQMLSHAEGVIKPAEIERDLDRVWHALKSCLEDAFIQLNAMREREGDFLFRDFKERLSVIENSIDRIESAATDLTVFYRNRLMDRIATLTKDIIELDPARISQEAAILADRSDISEETVRARSHLHQFRTLLSADGPVGRKLNFLLQEFNREFNTMASKAGNADISHTIVSVKSELEKLREQVQNVE